MITASYFPHVLNYTKCSDILAFIRLSFSLLAGSADSSDQLTSFLELRDAILSMASRPLPALTF